MTEAISMNFNYIEYTRYLHNIKMLYGRINRKATLTLRCGWKNDNNTELDDIELTECVTNIHTKGYEIVVSINGKPARLNKLQLEVLAQVSVQASAMTEWIVFDLSLDIRYSSVRGGMASIIPHEWIQSVAPFMLRERQRIEADFIIHDIQTIQPDADASIPKWYIDMWIQHTIYHENGFAMDDPSVDTVPQMRLLTNTTVRDISATDIISVPMESSKQTTDTCLSVERNSLPSFVAAAETRFLLKEFNRLYIRGTVANPDPAFVNAWQLSEYGYKHLYHPQWWNTLLTHNPTKYLTKAMNSDSEMTYMKAISLL